MEFSRIARVNDPMGSETESLLLLGVARGESSDLTSPLVEKGEGEVAESSDADHAHSIGSLAKSRDEYDTRTKAIEDRPAKDNKRIDELDKRVTTVEGAVGSKAYKRIENKDAKPGTVVETGVIVEPAPDAPAPPKRFWDPPKAPDAPAPGTP